MSAIRKYETAPLCALMKSDGEHRDKSECYRLVKIVILAINQFFGVTWVDYQLTEVAKEFYTKYWYWSQLDLKNFMHRCRSLYWGKSYGIYAPITLMQWAAHYDDEWVEASISETLNEHHRLKRDSDREHDVYNAERLADEREKDRNVREQLKKTQNALAAKTAEVKKMKGEE